MRLSTPAFLLREAPRRAPVFVLAVLLAVFGTLTACGSPSIVGTWEADVEPTLDAMLAQAPATMTAELRERLRREMRASLVTKLEVRADHSFSWAHTMKTHDGDVDDRADGVWRVEGERYVFFPKLFERQQYEMRMDVELDGDRLRVTAAGRPFRLRRT